MFLSSLMRERPIIDMILMLYVRIIIHTIGVSVNCMAGFRARYGFHGERREARILFIFKKKIFFSYYCRYIIMFIYIHTCIYIYTHIHVYTYFFICTYVCMYVCIYINSIIIINIKIEAKFRCCRLFASKNYTIEVK
jgi:hypothetical protein